MKYYILPVVLVFFIANVGLGQPGSVYFCSDEGKVLTYKVFDKKEKLSETVRETVTKCYTSGDSLVMLYSSVTYGEAGKVLSQSVEKAYHLRGVTYYVIDMSDMLGKDFYAMMEEAGLKNDISITPLIYELRDGWQPGQQLADRMFEMTFGKMSITAGMKNRKFVGNETITTPAGRFDCLKMSYDMNISAGPFSMKAASQVVWFAAGVGVVREETYEKKKLIETMVLQSIQ